MPKSPICFKTIQHPESQVNLLAAIFGPIFSFELNNLTKKVWKPDFDESMLLLTVKNDGILVHKASLLVAYVNAWGRKLNPTRAIGHKIYCEKNWHVVAGMSEVKNRLVLRGCSDDVKLRVAQCLFVTSVWFRSFSIQRFYFDKDNLPWLDLWVYWERNEHGKACLSLIQMQLLKNISVLIHPSLIVPYFGLEIKIWHIKSDHTLVVAWWIMHYQNWFTFNWGTVLVHTISQICGVIRAGVLFEKSFEVWRISRNWIFKHSNVWN